MDNWNSVDDLLDFAIDREQEAVDFYTALVGQAKNEAMADVFRDLAAQEMGHRTKLESVKKSGTLVPSRDKVADLKISDYLVDVEPGPDMDYQEALTVAMKREQAACNLYTDLAGAAENAELKSLLLALAQEEARHKQYFEKEYDETVLAEN